MRVSHQNEAQAAIAISDDRWKRLLECDAAADGKFVYAVKTTGVYCLASCPSRLPRPENVVFFASADTARRAGFRPCKRCKPLELMGGVPRAGKGDRPPLRAPGKGDHIRFAIGECSLGYFLVAQSGRGVCAILFGTGPEALAQDLRARFPRESLVGGDLRLEKVVARVAEFVDAPATGLDLPLDVHGSVFQRRVWDALREIKPGETASYTEIAQRIGSPKAVRAVAQACAANALAVAIPCHRAVRNDGGLSGYRWGVERKRILLKREARA